MTVPPEVHALPLYDKVAQLTAQNRVLNDMLDTMKQREQKFVRAISEMLTTPATSVASVRLDNGQWEVILNTGAVWRKVERCISTDSETRYFDAWVPRPAVPGSRAAIAQAVEADEPKAPLHLLPDRVA